MSSSSPYAGFQITNGGVVALTIYSTQDIQVIGYNNVLYLGYNPVAQVEMLYLPLAMRKLLSLGVL